MENKENKSSTNETVVYGNEKIISDECIESGLMLSQLVMLNATRIAFEKHIDIRNIIKECEETMAKYIRKNSSLDEYEILLESKNQNYLSFLSIALLADKLRCSVLELFINDDVKNAFFAASLIDKIKEISHKNYYQSFDVSYMSLGPEETATIWFYSFDYLFGLTEKLLDNNSLLKKKTMSLILSKSSFEERAEYTMSLLFDISSINPETENRYFPTSVFIWRENYGDLKVFIEDILKHYPQTYI